METGSARTAEGTGNSDAGAVPVAEQLVGPVARSGPPSAPLTAVAHTAHDEGRARPPVALVVVYGHWISPSPTSHSQLEKVCRVKASREVWPAGIASSPSYQGPYSVALTGRLCKDRAQGPDAWEGLAAAMWVGERDSLFQEVTLICSSALCLAVLTALWGWARG